MNINQCSIGIYRQKNRKEIKNPSLNYTSIKISIKTTTVIIKNPQTLIIIIASPQTPISVNIRNIFQPQPEPHPITHRQYTPKPIIYKKTPHNLLDFDGDRYALISPIHPLFRQWQRILPTCLQRHLHTIRRRLISDHAIRCEFHPRPYHGIFR